MIDDLLKHNVTIYNAAIFKGVGECGYYLNITVWYKQQDIYFRCSDGQTYNVPGYKLECPSCMCQLTSKLLKGDYIVESN